MALVGQCYCSLYTLDMFFQEGKASCVSPTGTARVVHAETSAPWLWRSPRQSVSGACPINPSTGCMYKPQAQAVVSLLLFLTLHQTLRAERLQEEPGAFWPVPQWMCEPFAATKLVPCYHFVLQSCFDCFCLQALLFYHYTYLPHMFQQLGPTCQLQGCLLLWPSEDLEKRNFTFSITYLMIAKWNDKRSFQYIMAIKWEGFGVNAVRFSPLCEEGHWFSKVMCVLHSTCADPPWQRVALWHLYNCWWCHCHILWLLWTSLQSPYYSALNITAEPDWSMLFLGLLPVCAEWTNDWGTM